MNAPQISPENVAHMLANEWDDVDSGLLALVADAIKANGDTIPASLVELLPVTVRAWDDGDSEESDCDHGEDYGEIAEGMWKDANYGDGDFRVTVSWEATDYDGKILDKGAFFVEGHTDEPECTAADEHEWTAEGEGGLTENPGVWSTGGTSMKCYTHCIHCGLRRIERTTGSQRNPGDCDTTMYEPAES